MQEVYWVFLWAALHDYKYVYNLFYKKPLVALYKGYHS